jgi:uncharacterized membrane protein YdjX (TVP38/TMEM64 family)
MPGDQRTPTDSDHAPAATRGTGRRALTRLVLVGLAIAGVVIGGRRAGALVPEFAGWVNGLGPWGPLVFIAGYVVACVAFIPGSLLTLAAGALFGVAKGVAIVFVGASLGASAAFLIARYLARGAVERRVARNPKFAAIDRAIGREGRKIVLLLRLSPVFPFSLLNYGLGLTQVRFIDYLLAMAGLLPGTLLYVYSGKLAGEVAAVAGGAAPPRSAGYYAVLALGLCATIAVTAVITRTARRALAEATVQPTLPGVPAQTRA